MAEVCAAPLIGHVVANEQPVTYASKTESSNTDPVQHTVINNRCQQAQQQEQQRYFWQHLRRL
jgi:hypothetical protein